MKNFLISAIVCGLVTITPNFCHAFPEGGTYFKGSFGVTDQSDSGLTVNNIDIGNISFGGGASFAGAYGFYKESGRFEIELVSQKNNADYFTDHTGSIGSGRIAGDISATQLLANYFMDFQSGYTFGDFNEGTILPYIGGGAGLFLIDFFDGSAHLESASFGFHVDAGISIIPSDSLILDIGIRYTSTLSEPTDDYGGAEFEWEYSNTTLIFGFRMNM
jgi:opacity protein-like surface antigen